MSAGKPAPLRDPAARRLGRYQLVSLLGRGGMGVVWRAWDPALERDVAVKLLHPELDDARFRQRALREARALARLQHPNVIAVHDVGEADGELFIATELIDGEPLDQWQRGKPPHRILYAYAQAARGLAAAHALGLVHRDVKPSNILVAHSGRVCIGDFGLATSASPTVPHWLPLRRPVAVDAARAAPPTRLATWMVPPEPPTPASGDGASRPAALLACPAPRSLPRLTVDGEVTGTPAYMAPEQRSGSLVDASADQYALCLALAEALLGYRPLDGADAAELAKSGVPAPWPVIARGLARQPAARSADLQPLIAALEAAVDAVERPAAPPRSPGALPQLAALAAGLSATGVALAIGLAWATSSIDAGEEAHPPATAIAPRAAAAAPAPPAPAAPARPAPSADPSAAPSPRRAPPSAPSVDPLFETALEILRASPKVFEIHPLPAISRIAVLARDHHLFLYNPDGGTREPLAQLLDTDLQKLAGDDDDLWFATPTTIMRSHRGAKPEAIARFPPWFHPLAIDAAGVVAWRADRAIIVADLVAQSMRVLEMSDSCMDSYWFHPFEVRLSEGWIEIHTDRAIELIDPRGASHVAQAPGGQCTSAAPRTLPLASIEPPFDPASRPAREPPIELLVPISKLQHGRDDAAAHDLCEK